MKDIQPDKRKIAGGEAVHGLACAFLCRLKTATIAICVVLSQGLISGTAHSQYTMVAPVPPVTMAQQPVAASYFGNAAPVYANNYSQPAVPYANAGYGYTVTPATGLYYSGNSPMLQPQVVMPHYGGMAYGGMTPPNGYNPYDAYGMGQYQPHVQQNEHVSDYEAAAQVTGQSTAGAYGQYMPLRSPLLETGWETAKLLSPFNAPDGPHRGVGKPLEDESWLDRPYYFGVFGGCVSGSTLVGGQIDQGSGGNGGVSLGWNLNHYWGVEGRIFGSSIDIKDISGSATPAPKRSCQLTILDVSAHYYPYGEARWRPYFKTGIGYAQQRFNDNAGARQNINTLTVPFGVGLKYWWSDRVNVFGEVVDNIIFGSGPTKTQSDWALNFGVNFTFGTNPNYHPTVYWPQTPSKPY